MRERLQISQAESQSIEQEVFAPVQKKQENLNKYEKALREALAEEGSLDSDWIWEELKRIQERYELQDEEVEPIRQKINLEIQQQQKEYNNKLQQYELKFSKAVEREYPLSSDSLLIFNSWQQSLGLRPEDIQRIEQPILAAKYQEKLKEEERQKAQEAERARQLELQKQREHEEYQRRQKEERLKREQEERLRPQPQENIPSQPQPRQAGFLSSKKARRSGLLGSTAAVAFLFLFDISSLQPTVIVVVFFLCFIFVIASHFWGVPLQRYSLRWWMCGVACGAIVLGLWHALPVVWGVEWGGSQWSWMKAPGVLREAILQRVRISLIVYLTSIYIGRW